MKDLTQQIKKACNEVSNSNNVKHYGAQIKKNLKKITELDGPGLYVQIFQNNLGSNVYDANGNSKSSHQKPKIIVATNSNSVKPGKAHNGINRTIDYIKHFNLPEFGYEGVQPNTRSKHFKLECKSDWKGKSYYNMSEIYSDVLLFFGWLSVDSARTADEIEKIWNNSVTDCLNNRYTKATFGKSKGSMSETHMLVDFSEEDLENIKTQILENAVNKIEKIKSALKY